MKSRLASARKNLTISSPPTRRTANLNGSETHTRTNRNSKGACTHEEKRKPFTVLGPLSTATSINVAPRLKKPITLDVNIENAASRRIRVGFGIGGVERSLPSTRGYANERATGMQLLKKMRNITATDPREAAARTGVVTREMIKTNRSSRKPDEEAVTSAPAREPRPKATRVAPNAISMNFMVNSMGFQFFGEGVR